MPNKKKCHFAVSYDKLSAILSPESFIFYFILLFLFKIQPVTRKIKKVAASDKLTLFKILFVFKHYFFGCFCPVWGVVAGGVVTGGVVAAGVVVVGLAVGSVGTAFGSTVFSICFCILDFC